VRRFPRDVALEPRFAELIPEVLHGISPEQFAALAAQALTPKPPPTVSVSHLHAPPVSLTEQLMLVRGRLAVRGTVTFRALSGDCAHTLEVVARFLALLELYRQQRVVFEQLTPLGELHVRWTGGDVPASEDDAHDGADDATEDLDEEYS
jgi:segregation and condensation protein A